MSYMVEVLPQPRSLIAFQLVEGQTTATMLRDFSPSIRVGAYEGDERKLVYVLVTTPSGQVEGAYGDWIVKDNLGNLEVCNGEEFLRLFRPADEAAAATIRERDTNNPRVAADTRLAKSFAQSLRE